MPKGKKICDNCGLAVGVRTRQCPECGHKFSFAVKSKESKRHKIIRNFNWKELQPGDIIKVSGGPYYLLSNMERSSMGERGKYRVIGLDKNGILAWSVGKNGGFCHIYMGKDDQCRDTLVYRKKHKISKLKQKHELTTN